MNILRTGNNSFKKLILRIGGPSSHRLLTGVSWSVAGGVISAGSTLGASILVARWLGPTTFGSLSIIESTLDTITVVAGPSLGLTATKHIAELRDRDPARAAQILRLNTMVAFWLSAILALILFLAAPYLAANTLAAGQLVVPLQLAALALFLVSINSAQIGALAGFEAFNSIAKISLLKGLITFPAMWVLTMRYGLVGSVASLSIVAGLACIVSELYLRREIRRAQFPSANRGYWREARLLVTFSLPAMLLAIMFLAPVWLSNVIIVHEQNGYSELGIFNAANQWRAAILFLPSMMTTTFLAILANLAGKGSMSQYRAVFLISVIGMTLIALVPAGVVIIASGQIMNAYGPGFSTGALVLIIIAVASALAAPCSAILQAITSIGNLWKGVALTAVWGFIFLATVLVLRHRGAEGLAIAYAIAYAVQLVLFAGYAYVFLKPAMARVQVGLLAAAE